LLSDARSAELSAEQALAVALPMMRSTQEIWYELSALRERATTTWSIAAERLRAAEQQQLPLATRDLAVMDAETAEALAEQNLLELAVTAAAETLVQAEQAHAKVNGELVVAEAAYASTRAAAADRRDGLSRLQARSTAAQARLDAGAEESERLRLRATAEMERVAVARDELALLARPELQQSLIDAEVLATAAHGELDAARERSRESVAARAMATARSAALSGRIEALQLSRNNAAGKLQLPGLGGAVSESIKVSRGWELAVAAALGQAAAALTADTLKQGASALHTIAEQQLGRTGLLISGVSATLPASDPPAGVWLLELLQVAPPLQGAFSRLLTGFVALENVTEALLLVAAAPELTVVTKAGEIISAWFMAGGSSQRSGIELQAALDEAATELASATLTLERSERLVTQTAQQERTAAEKTVAADKLLTSLRSEVGAYEQRHAQLTATITAAEAAVARAETDIAAALAARVRDEEHLAEITARITAVTAGGDTAEPDPTERDRLAQLVSSSSHAELEARMGLRTAEERLRLAAERTAAFVRAAENERASQQLFAERMARAVHEAEVAKAVHTGAGYLLSVIENARNLAATERQLAEEARSVAETSLGAARARVRETLATLDELVAGAHRDEMLQVERKLRIEGLADRGVAEFGLDVETLLAEYGPDQLVPTLLTLADESAGVEPKPPVPYQRDAQLRRARKAENDLLVLGAINPLALEEFDALNARHSYLAGQLADITATHKDLLGIVVEVDMKVQEAFAAAFTDVAAAFENVFARLFPGGKGKLTLHNPDDMLTTGVLVSARPAGKKVERLALLSGGERSLVAIAFLLALFIARPSPFYILDEVEAALDETNLARLLAVYEELRAKSQLLIITHQKRTMEIADALYGITMKSDGVSKVVSQRLID
jgi:chromosome segregation protein